MLANTAQDYEIYFLKKTGHYPLGIHKNTARAISNSDGDKEEEEKVREVQGVSQGGQDEEEVQNGLHLAENAYMYKLVWCVSVCENRPNV